jgi:tRNA(Ile)-lysidine synthase
VGIEKDIPWLKEAAGSAKLRRQKHLVAVSGGADSVALLHLLLDVGFSNLIVCHLDHRLRGRASTEDAKFVERLAKRLGLPVEIGRTQVKELMVSSGESMETAARNARHRFFADCAGRHRCERVLLAHHADDQAETMLWNLLRGSRGLKGMRPEQTLHVGATELCLIRPLLSIRRKALVDWLNALGIKWREDASNREPVAVRNRLRNEVLPLLDEISGRDSVAALIRVAADFSELEEFESQALAEASVRDPQGRMHLPALRKLPPLLQRAAIRQFLLDCGVTSIDRRLLDEAMELLDPASAPGINLPGGRHLRRKEGRLWIAD